MFIHLSNCKTRWSIPILKKSLWGWAVYWTSSIVYTQSCTSLSDVKWCPQILRQWFLNFSMWDFSNNSRIGDLTRWACLRQTLSFSDTPPSHTHGISCAIPVHMNMTCCVHHKQQIWDDRFFISLLLQQSKIVLPLVLLYSSPSLMLDEHTNL